MIIKGYKDFKNLILENKPSDDDPFASIEKQIKGTFNRIRNRLSKDGVVIEKGKSYFILGEDDSIVKKILMGKEERKEIAYKILNDSNVGKYPKDKVITNKINIKDIRKLEIYYSIDNLIKKYPDFKNKRPLILQQQYIEPKTEDKQKNSGDEKQAPQQDQVQKTKEPIDTVQDKSTDMKGDHPSQSQKEDGDEYVSTSTA